MARVSIVLPAYNAGLFLYQAIDSVLKQTYSDFKLIIVNDGSTDNSLEIIEAFKDDRIVVINNESNSGLIYSLNIGLENSDGEYIARMDADDILLENWLEKQIEFLDINEDVVISSSSRLVFVGNNIEKTKVFRVPVKDDMIRAFSIFNSPFSHPSIVMRNKIVREFKLKYDEDFKYCEDYKLWIDFLKYGKGYNFYEPLIKYRITKNSQTAIGVSNNEQRKENILKIQQEACLLSNINIPEYYNDILYSFSLTENMFGLDFERYKPKDIIIFLDLIYKAFNEQGYSSYGHIVLGKQYLKFLYVALKKYKLLYFLKCLKPIYLYCALIFLVRGYGDS